MAWTTPRTWVSLTKLRASELNTDIRDNTNYLKQRVDAHDTYVVELAAALQAGAVVDEVDGSSRIHINFNGPFAQPPIVIVSLGDYAGGHIVGALYNTVTLTGCDAFVVNEDGTPATGDTVRLHWHAYAAMPTLG